jgi:hypothetical protein
MDRLVSEEEYRSTVERLGAREDLAVRNPGGIGEVERWLTDQGRICAYLIVRYFKGEHDWDYYVVDEPRIPPEPS